MCNKFLCDCVSKEDYNIQMGLVIKTLEHHEDLIEELEKRIKLLEQRNESDDDYAMEQNEYN